MKIEDWKKRKFLKEKISMLTCYDFTLAQVLNKTKIDALLIGDSSSMVMFGESSTLSSSVDNLSQMCLAVSKGAQSKFIVCDLPFGFMQMSDDTFFSGVKKIMSCGANALKIEGFEGHGKKIEQLIQMGVPVMGHLGLMPQHIQNYGGFKVQGKTDPAKVQILNWAKQLQKLGVFAIVLECIPVDLADVISKELDIPTIGIGAGPSTDGQILVLHDFLGLTDFKAKFVRQYMDGSKLIQESVDKYVSDVNSSEFPSAGETYA
jgi:3-methyl-2-oxobutanoate hydroxymethyltransferase